MNPTDETTILRFASGELDADDESTFLAQCELRPEAWRETVLAVAEHHRIVEALGDLAAEDLPSPAAAPARRARAWRPLPVAAAALAAGIALGIVTMYATGLGSPRRAQVVKTPQPAQSPPPEPAPDRAVSTVAAAKATPDALPEQAWPPAVGNDFQRAMLVKHGFEVEEEPTVYVITTANGTRWAVPTQRTTLHFVKR